MEVENVDRISSKTEKDGDDVSLPGFRFHPTDEELVGFYLRRKVEKKPTSNIDQLIKQVDIYKYDPWDLPKSSNVSDNECYFFCKRGRKYRNSVRPNRVTCSGFWKATGIDKQIYSSSGHHISIGLKKSLVYYRGSAGKGTKTDWMMHEFRLPASHDETNKNMDDKAIAQEAEVWTLCRILKRNNNSYRKSIPDWRSQVAPDRSTLTTLPVIDASSKTCSVESNFDQSSSYISFNAPHVTSQIENKPYSCHANDNIANPHFFGNLSPNSAICDQEAPSFSNSTSCGDISELLKHNWEDLQSIVDCAAASSYNQFYL